MKPDLPTLCTSSVLISFTIRICSMNRPLRSPASPALLPATLRSWHGLPPMMQSTTGSSCPSSCVISPKCFMYSLPFLSFSRTKSADSLAYKLAWADCFLLIMCGTALDFFCFLCVLLESTDALSVRIMPHTIRPERARLNLAQPNFLRNIATAVEALGADSFERRKYFCHISYPPARCQRTCQQSPLPTSSHRAGLRFQRQGPAVHRGQSVLSQTRS